VEYEAVILAAGKGTRMRSEIPKEAHQVAGKPMVLHVVNAVRAVGAGKIILVVGHGREQVQSLFDPVADAVQFALQEEQLGTGHALMQAQEMVNPDHNVLVLPGDTPLLQAGTLAELMRVHEESGAAATVLSTRMENPYGYGRIVRSEDGTFQRIVEEKDASEEEKSIQEINSGMYCFKAREAFTALKNLSTANAQGEYYLTDILELLNQQGQKVAVCLLDAGEDIYGINDRVQLAEAEKILRRRKNEALMRSGVTIMDPASTFIDLDVEVGSDTVLYPFTILEGQTRIGSRCMIGPSTRIRDSIIGSDVHIESSSINQASIDDSCNIGPFAYLRPGAQLGPKVKIGDFVEVKKSKVGEGSKIPHLSYVGDSILGKEVNVGAGTITCNYDGTNKWQTILEDGAFIGSNTNLVAPVRVGSHATTGAGSTITRDVPDHALAVERAEQKHIQDWKLRKE
jgi:bifunctional UDP-N-acetylglucosamine pyrophosphorylase/glucosamine-1-phosphate N-acetyltransferase